MILHRSGGGPAGADEAAGPAATRLPLRRVTAIMLLAAAALDLTRCGLVVGTVTQAGTAAALGVAAFSLWTACGCQRGARWSGWAAFLIGIASGPQAAASGFHAVYAIPDMATAVLGGPGGRRCPGPRGAPQPAAATGEPAALNGRLLRHLNDPILRNVLV